MKKKMIEGDLLEIIDDDQPPKEIVIDEDPLPISPQTEKDELDIDGPEVIEVDPFDQPTRNQKSRKPRSNRTK